MTESVAATTPFMEVLKHAGESAAGAPCLRPVRERAAGFLDSAVLPGIKDEDWRYTDLRGLSRRSFPVLNEGSAGDVVAIEKVLTPEDINVVICNGIFSAARSSGSLQQGFSILTGEKAVAAACEDSFDLVTGNDSELLLRLNELHFQGLVVIDIARHVDLARPIHVLYSFDEGSAEKAVFPRILIRLAEGARAKVFESTLVQGEKSILVNAVTDIRLAEGAALEIVQSCRNTPEMFRFASTRVVQKRDSRLRSFLFTDGARIFRGNLSVLLEGEGAEAVVNGLHRLKDIRHADSHTFVEHIAPNSRSTQLYKAILEGESRSVFNGRIRVRREAQLTNSYQLNKNLLLSREARVDTKPQLEIFADDVKCSHGATIGQLDEEQLFYLGTRGIAKDAAMSMLIRGFIDDVVGLINDPALRQRLVQTMD